MSKFPLWAFLLSCVIVWVNPAFSANYYFSNRKGDDSRSFAEAQNPESPWQSLEKFNQIFSQLQAGDAVYFHRAEVFNGGLLLNRSGTQAAPITIGAYGEGADPVISGFDVVREWTSAGDGVYQSEALGTGATVNMVVIDNVNYPKGRWPNADAADGAYLVMESVSGKTLTNQRLSGGSNWSGGQVVIRTAHWTIERAPITSHSGSKLSYGGSTVYSPKQGYGFFVQDHINTLDQFGEWYYDPASRKISVFLGDQGPEGIASVKVAAKDILLEVRASDVVVENLVLEGANQYGVANLSHHVERFSLLHSKVIYSGIDGVFLHGAYHTTLENNQVWHSNNCGLKLFYCPNTTLRYNDIRNSGMQAGMGDDGDGTYMGVLSEATGFVAEYNRIINTGYVGLRFGEGDNLIKNNFIDTFCATMDDGAGIYGYGSEGNMANRKITGNIVLNGIGANDGTPATTHTAAEGIYLDDNTRDIEVSDNTVAWCKSNGLFVHNAQNFKIVNNTLFDNRVQFLLKSDRLGNAIRQADIRDNIYFSKEIAETVFHINSDADDINEMGTLNRNYYVRPLYDELPILAEYANSSGVILKEPIGLEFWYSNFGHGQDSEKSPMQLEAYSIDGISGGNKLPVEGFDNNIVGLWCFSPYSDCAIDWVSGSPVNDGGALEVSGPSPSRIGMNCGSLSNTKQYIVRFEAAASQPAGMEVYLMQANSPWEIISSTLAVQLETEAQTYELLISFPENESLGTIQFQFGKENTTYWLDNVQMYEAQISATEPDDFILFEYNASTAERQIDLEGEYVDGKGNAYSGNITLGAYQSAVLIKTDDEPIPPKQADEDGDGVPDDLDRCPGFDDKIDEDRDGTPDGCDDCVILPGTPCDDGDACTIDDIYDKQCNCSGTLADSDSDGDGVCDGEDKCPGFDDREDADKDGIPDQCDDCAGMVSSVCPSGDCDVNGDPIPSDEYQASVSITSNGAVAEGATVVFKAGEIVKLEPGFVARSGADFKAMIENCVPSGPMEVETEVSLRESLSDGNSPAEEPSAEILTLERPSRQYQWKVYPNPVGQGQAELNIEFHTDRREVQLQIINQLGQVVDAASPETEAGWNRFRWDVSRLPAGTYYIYDRSAAGTRSAYPFVIMHR